MEGGEGALALETGAEMIDYLVRRRVQMDQDELVWSVVAARFAQTDEYDAQGFVSPFACIKARCHMSGGAVSARICAGEELERLDKSVAAVEAGEIGFAHFAQIANTSAKVGERLDETTLLRHARKEGVAKFRETCIHARHAADPEGVVEEEVEGVEMRELTLTDTDDGLVAVSGTLDKVGGAALRTALEPLAKLMGKDDRRRYPRRLADALVEFSMNALDRSQLQVTTSLETLLGLTGAPAAEMEFSLPISSKAVERLACDCTVTRILLASDSTVIDVGRSKRTVSGPARRALDARDGHCRWPGGCDRPARWSAAHHVVHWTHGGSTDLDNLILLCHRHHWMVHEGGWQIVRSDDGRMLAIPPATEFQRLPRGPD